MSNDLSKEGSVLFEIGLDKNPNFKSPSSNITFMLDNDIGKVKLTVLKEKEVLRVVVNNSVYGVSRLESDISKKLNQDLKVAITWTSELATLYLTGIKVAESMYA